MALMFMRPLILCLALIPWVLAAQAQGTPPNILPASATNQLARSLQAATARSGHLWLDTPPLNADGTVNGYVEIAVGERRKWEFDMTTNARRLDRMIPSEIGGYPVNYGYVPQTVSYDGDPFDVLVLGPPLPGGRMVRGAIVGVMYMEDEKGHDTKVVLSRIAADGRRLDRLTPEVQARIGSFFNRYKLNQPGMFAKVSGWGSAAEGLAYVRMTHAFFLECRLRAGLTCELPVRAPAQ